MTLAESILQFVQDHPNGTISVYAPSNNAVDIIVDRFVKHGTATEELIYCNLAICKYFYVLAESFPCTYRSVTVYALLLVDKLLQNCAMVSKCSNLRTSACSRAINIR